MDLKNILNESANVNITISIQQLKEAIDYAIIQAKEAFETKQEPEHYLTRNQVAKLVNVNLSTLWRWNNEGYLATIEIGGKRMYRLSDLKRIYKIDPNTTIEEITNSLNSLQP